MRQILLSHHDLNEIREMFNRHPYPSDRARKKAIALYLNHRNRIKDMIESHPGIYWISAILTYNFKLDDRFASYAAKTSKAWVRKMKQKGCIHMCRLFECSEGNRTHIHAILGFAHCPYIESLKDPYLSIQLKKDGSIPMGQKWKSLGKWIKGRGHIRTMKEWDYVKHGYSFLRPIRYVGDPWSDLGWITPPKYTCTHISSAANQTAWYMTKSLAPGGKNEDLKSEFGKMSFSRNWMPQMAWSQLKQMIDGDTK